MLKSLTAAAGLAALATLAGCADEETVAPARAPVQEMVVAQPQPQQVVVAQPRAQEVVVAQPAPQQVVVEEVPVEHVRRAPVVVYNGQRVYWHRNRWYYMNGGRWTYYTNEPVELRGRRYVVAY